MVTPMGRGLRRKRPVCTRARRLGNGIVWARAFQEASNPGIWGGERSRWGGAEMAQRDLRTPSTLLLVVFGSEEADFESRFQDTSGKGSGSPALCGDLARKQLPSWTPLSPSRSPLGFSHRHKGRVVMTAQAREPPRLLGVVVRLRNGRSPARAGGGLGCTSTHAPSLPPCLAGPLFHPSTGRGFLVMYSSKSPEGVIRPRPAFS